MTPFNIPDFPKESLDDWEPPNYKPEEYTCFGCPHEKDCEYAWDYYNINGDCLALK